MATYNGGKYIKDQIASILPQLKLSDELVISDDSSTDNTIEIIRSFNDKRIKIIENQQFKSPIFNFENALKHSDGDVIFLSDQDDKWSENKVEVMLSALQKYDLVVSNAFIGDGSLNIIRDSYFEWRKSRNGILKNFVRNSYLGCCMAFKRKVIQVALPFPKDIPMHDMWLGMISEIYFKPVFIKDKLMIYRRHDENATFLNEDFTSNETLSSKFKFRYNLFLAIVRRIINKKRSI
ncbi:glycosyltransferase family 2 protein [Pedobacter sp. ASV1-7]|uniref:glycosyltransferase family 2 protein n=1 Tax=Pedobacter sp. ASV1-7 TaxID=3145237 RepID=UPI0032E87723